MGKRYLEEPTDSENTEDYIESPPAKSSLQDSPRSNSEGTESPCRPNSVCTDSPYRSSRFRIAEHFSSQWHVRERGRSVMNSGAYGNSKHNLLSVLCLSRKSNLQRNENESGHAGDDLTCTSDTDNSQSASFSQLEEWGSQRDSSDDGDADNVYHYGDPQETSHELESAVQCIPEDTATQQSLSPLIISPRTDLPHRVQQNNLDCHYDKHKYKSLMKSAKLLKRENRVEDAIEIYQQAYSMKPSDTLVRRIRKYQKRLRKRNDGISRDGPASSGPPLYNLLDTGDGRTCTTPYDGHSETQDILRLEENQLAISNLEPNERKGLQVNNDTSSVEPGTIPNEITGDLNSHRLGSLYVCVVSPQGSRDHGQQGSRDQSPQAHAFDELACTSHSDASSERQLNTLLMDEKHQMKDEEIMVNKDCDERKDLGACKSINHNELLGRSATVPLYIIDDSNEEQAEPSTAHPTEEDPVDLEPQVKPLDTYKELMGKARKLVNEDKVAEAIDAYREAYALKPSIKLQRTVNKWQKYLEPDNKDRPKDDMAHVGNGFYLNKDLFGKLYPHQKESLQWFWKLHNMKRGGILADDMGLGKTIQVISFLYGLYDASRVKTVLLVMPLSLIENWKREFQTWAPTLQVFTYHGGSTRERNKTLSGVQRQGGILLTSYGMIVSAAECIAKKDGDVEGTNFKWDYVILDEGHKIKNPTKTSKGVHLIAAKHRIILTGTPVQNNLKEMWALFDWAHRGTLLGTISTFKSEYEEPITRAREKCASQEEKRLGEEMSQSLKQFIAPYFLRRTKQEVKMKCKQRTKQNDEVCGPEMPNMTRKNDFVIWCYLSEIQLKIYRSYIDQPEIDELLCTRKSPLTALDVLKKICDHPRRMSNNVCHKLGLTTPNELENADDDTMKDCAANTINSIDDAILVAESGKLEFLVQLMSNLKQEGHRTLIFSQSRKMLDIIHKVLGNRGHVMMRLDGKIISLKEREKRISQFQSQPDCDTFLLSTQVGGVGLTLTAADRVVIYDPAWNPATDSQAVDRAFRIGQQKNVVIYRLITCGTVEEKIYRRQVFKDSVTRQTMQDETQNLFRYFKKTDLSDLFELSDFKTSETQRQLEQMHSHQRMSDETLDKHIAYLHTCAMFGISDHNLMFSQEDEEIQETANSDYIKRRVSNAIELLARESEANNELIESGGTYMPDYSSKSRRRFHKSESYAGLEVKNLESLASGSFQRYNSEVNSPFGMTTNYYEGHTSAASGRDLSMDQPLDFSMKSNVDRYHNTYGMYKDATSVDDLRYVNTIKNDPYYYHPTVSQQGYMNMTESVDNTSYTDDSMPNSCFKYSPVSDTPDNYWMGAHTSNTFSLKQEANHSSSLIHSRSSTLGYVHNNGMPFNGPNVDRLPESITGSVYNDDLPRNPLQDGLMLENTLTSTQTGNKPNADSLNNLNDNELTEIISDLDVIDNRFVEWWVDQKESIRDSAHPSTQLDNPSSVSQSVEMSNPYGGQSGGDNSATNSTSAGRRSPTLEELLQMYLVKATNDTVQTDETLGHPPETVTNSMDSSAENADSSNAADDDRIASIDNGVMESDD